MGFSSRNQKRSDSQVGPFSLFDLLIFMVLVVHALRAIDCLNSNRLQAQVTGFALEFKLSIKSFRFENQRVVQSSLKLPKLFWALPLCHGLPWPRRKTFQNRILTDYPRNVNTA